MSKTYNALVALPSRTIGAVSGLIGVGSAFWPTWFEEKLGTQITSETLRTAGLILMAASAAYFALLWWLKPDGRTATESGENSSNQTAGSNSPAINSGGGNVTLHYGPPNPAPTQERKQAFNPDRTTEPSKARSRAAAYTPPARGDTDLKVVVDRILTRDQARKLEGEAAKNYVRSINTEIMDRVTGDALTVWARLGNRGRQVIGKYDLTQAELNILKGVLSVPGSWTMIEYSDVQFVGAEIEKIWPSEEGEKELDESSANYRRRAIAECREMIANYDGDHSLRSQRRAMESCPAYLALERHLPEHFIKFMHQKALAVIDPDANSDVPEGLRALKRHLSDLEEKWKL